MAFNNLDFNLIELLQIRSQTQPKRLAYAYLSDSAIAEIPLNRSQLEQSARRIAGYLQSRCSAQDRVLLVYPAGLDFVKSLFGCFFAGVIAIPVNVPQRKRQLNRIKAIVADAQPNLVLTSTELLPNLQRLFAEDESLKSLECLATDTIDSQWQDQWQKLAIDRSTIAVLQYTSGSTGNPKGVMVSHGNFLQNLACIEQSFQLSPEDFSITWLPHFHDMGLVDGILQPLYSDFPAVIMPPAIVPQQPIQWLQAISRYRATHSGGPNFAWNLCINKTTPEQRANLDLSCWRSGAYNGAEPVSPETLKAFTELFSSCGFQPEFVYPCYGMAEATLMISGVEVQKPPLYLEVDAAALAQKRVVEVSNNQVNGQGKVLVGCGKPWLDTKIVIVDPKSTEICPPDRVGEIWVSGASVAQGYWEQPEETAKAFEAKLPNVEGSFLRTGDLGFMTHDQLFIVGRLKDLIIIRGRNYYPQDIEVTVESSHPFLRQNSGAAFAVEMDGEEKLVVVQEVERTALRQLDVPAVVKEIRQAVSEVHELQVYAITLLKTASIPTTSSGKIQRQACKAGFLAGTLQEVGAWVMPKQEDINIKPLEDDTLSVEDFLVDRLASILTIDPDEIDYDDPFAQYGLDSSIILSLTSELSDRIGKPLEPSLMWEYPNLNALLTYLEEFDV